MVKVTTSNVSELRASVAKYSARDTPVLNPTKAGFERRWFDQLDKSIRASHAAWAVLTDEQRSLVVETESALAEFEVAELATFSRQQTLSKRSHALTASGCRLTDQATEAVVQNSADPTEAYACASTWAASRERPWLVLSGSTGSGKSFAAACVTANTGGIWVRADELVRIFWANFGDQYERQDELRNTGMLVIDDVGCELDANRMLAALLDLLDARKSARSHPTIITTNLNKKAFAERYANERLMSRMSESVQWEALDGSDMRRAKAAAR